MITFVIFTFFNILFFESDFHIPPFYLKDKYLGEILYLRTACGFKDFIMP